MLPTTLMTTELETLERMQIRAIASTWIGTTLFLAVAAGLCYWFDEKEKAEFKARKEGIAS